MFGLWISAILFIAIISSQEIRNHNITATKTDIEKLSIKKTDTLFLASRLGDSVGNDQTWEYNNRSNTFNGVFGNLWEGKNKVKINLRQGDKSFSFMELKYSSNGATQEKAQKNAAKIFYNWSFTENVLDLDPLWEIAPSTPFYNQKLTINLHLQEGQVVFINKKLKPLLSSSIDNDQEFSRRQIIGHYWRMGSDKLECLDCLDNQQQINIQYQDKSGEQKINLNVDNQGLTIKKK